MADRQPTGLENGDAFGKRPRQSGKPKRAKQPKGPKDVVKSSEKLGERTLRRSTTDPFTTHVAMEEFISVRTGRGLHRPSPDLAPRFFPGARSLFGEPEKRLGIAE